MRFKFYFDIYMSRDYTLAEPREFPAGWTETVELKMRAIVKLLAGAFVGLVVVVLGIAIPTAETKPKLLRTAEANRINSIEIGESDLYFHFTQNEGSFNLHIMVVSLSDLDDIMLTRVSMKDGQRFSMVLHDEDQNADEQGTRIVFDRIGDSIMADTIETNPENVIAFAGWPFN